MRMCLGECLGVQRLSEDLHLREKPPKHLASKTGQGSPPTGTGLSKPRGRLKGPRPLCGLTCPEVRHRSSRWRSAQARRDIFAGLGRTGLKGRRLVWRVFGGRLGRAPRQKLTGAIFTLTIGCAPVRRRQLFPASPHPTLGLVKELK